MKCGYIRDTWDCGDTLEVEEKHTGRYGAAGQKREQRKEPTPEDIMRQNQWKRVRDLRRLIKWNFTTGDSWITLTCICLQPDYEVGRSGWIRLERQ